MGRFKHIPDERENELPNHAHYQNVFRAVKNTKVLDYNDFLPWNIEHKDQIGNFESVYDIALNTYGTSIFDNIDILKEKVRFSIAEQIKAIAIGETKADKGVVSKKKNHHINYYLFDYENKSPKDDFRIHEVKP